jgi:hypothetical protein
MAFRVPNECRVRRGPYGSDDTYGNNGLFCFSVGMYRVRCIASDQGMPKGFKDRTAWEHVSVSLDEQYCPSWEVMAVVKSIFWEPEDVVMQLHPAASSYVNHHPYTLHLWRPVGKKIPTPPVEMVGPLAEPQV